MELLPDAIASEWRRQAEYVFRQYLHKDLADFVTEEDSIYELFFELLPLCRQAHQSNDILALRGIYNFAEWCLQQQEQDVWNAAGVAFYEHLVDDQITRGAIAEWLKREVFEQVEGLFESRMEAEEFACLKQAYYQKRKQTA